MYGYGLIYFHFNSAILALNPASSAPLIIWISAPSLKNLKVGMASIPAAYAPSAFSSTSTFTMRTASPCSSAIATNIGPIL